MENNKQQEEEYKFQQFIFNHIDIYDSIKDKQEKSFEIVKSIKHYFTKIYTNVDEATLI